MKEVEHGVEHEMPEVSSPAGPASKPRGGWVSSQGSPAPQGTMNTVTPWIPVALRRLQDFNRRGLKEDPVVEEWMMRS